MLIRGPKTKKLECVQYEKKKVLKSTNQNEFQVLRITNFGHFIQISRPGGHFRASRALIFGANLVSGVLHKRNFFLLFLAIGYYESTVIVLAFLAVLYERV